MTRPLSVRRLDRRSSTGIETHPARTLGLKARKRERVRCSSLVDWPVYPRLRRIMQGSERARNAGRRGEWGVERATPSIPFNRLEQKVYKGWELWYP